MWLLAQTAEQFPNHPIAPYEPAAVWILVVFQIVAWLITAPYFLFWIWMLLHCYRTEPDQYFWFWVMIIAQPIGTIAYFILRYLPSKEFPAPTFFRRWTRGRELTRLEVAARQIGNPHQFNQWGDALREVGFSDQARDAYEQALKKDPQNIQALWGSALVAVTQKRFADVRSLSRQVLDKDPQYKFGDVSLAYGRALKELGETDAAKSHFEQHMKRWRHPEAMYLLAQLCLEKGESNAAREHLLMLIQDIDGCPIAIARKNGRWRSRAKQLVRKIKT